MRQISRAMQAGAVVEQGPLALERREDGSYAVVEIVKK